MESPGVTRSAMGPGAMLTRRVSMESPGVTRSAGILGRHDLRGTPCSRKREHATQRTPWPTRSHWQDRHPYHRQFYLVAFTDRCSGATNHWPLFSRPAPQTEGRELGLFSGSIPPWFVLSNDLSTTNTRAIWLCLGAFLAPPASCLQFHWLLATDYHSPIPRPSPQAGTSGVGSCADPSPPATAIHRQTDWQRPNGPDLDDRPLSSVCHRTRRFLRKNQFVSSPLAAAQPLTILSWPETLNASGSRRACRMAISRNVCALPDFPEFAQAVRCGVPGTPESGSSCRVEVWRGGLGRCLCSPCWPALSVAGVTSSRPCSVSTPRSSNRAGGVPAPGFRTRLVQ